MIHVLIVTGGSIHEPSAKEYIQNKTYDHVIAADAGLVHCESLGLAPTEILGDFDSLPDRDRLSYWEKQGVRIHTFPGRKDFTDTDLALRLSLSFKPDTVDILGGTGTRLDHTIANTGFLVRMEEAGVLCRMIDAHNIVEIIKGPSKRAFPCESRWTYLSVIAMTPEASGVTMEGFSYPVEDQTFRFYDSLGISNEITAPEGVITVEKGVLLVIRARD